jgi:hypothetical protein
LKNKIQYREMRVNERKKHLLLEVYRWETSSKVAAFSWLLYALHWENVCGFVS